MNELDKLYRGVREYQDEIQHYGNRNSGRYPRGSGKHPDSTLGRIRGLGAVTKQAKIDRTGKDATTDTPYVQYGSGKTIYPKSWSKDKINNFEAALKKRPIVPDEHLTPATKAQITSAEKQLGVTFSKEYKSMMEQHGSFGFKGHEIYGVDPKHPRLDTVKNTKWARENDSKAPKDSYMVENTGWDGLTIWQKTDGSVHEKFPNQDLHKLTNSLTEYLNINSD